MIAVLDRRDGWVGPSFLTRMDYEASLGWNSTSSARPKWRSSLSARGSVLKKSLTPPTLSEKGFINNYLCFGLDASVIAIRRT